MVYSISLFFPSIKILYDAIGGLKYFIIDYNDETLYNQPWWAIKYYALNNLFPANNTIMTGLIFNGGIYGYIGYILFDKYGAFIIWHYDNRNIKVITDPNSSDYRYTIDWVNWNYF